MLEILNLRYEFDKPVNNSILFVIVYLEYFHLRMLDKGNFYELREPFRWARKSELYTDYGMGNYGRTRY